jgi:hypothetical protein
VELFSLLPLQGYQDMDGLSVHPLGSVILVMMPQYCGQYLVTCRLVWSL